MSSRGAIMNERAAAQAAPRASAREDNELPTRLAPSRATKSAAKRIALIYRTRARMHAS